MKLATLEVDHTGSVTAILGEQTVNMPPGNFLGNLIHLTASQLISVVEQQMEQQKNEATPTDPEAGLPNSDEPAEEGHNNNSPS